MLNVFPNTAKINKNFSSFLERISAKEQKNELPIRRQVVFQHDGYEIYDKINHK